MTALSLLQTPVTGSKDIVITCIIFQLTVDVDDKTGTLVVTTNCIIVITIVSVHYQLLIVHGDRLTNLFYLF